MSGVVDHNNQQWEHCMACGDFKKFPQDLGHEKPTTHHTYGRMLCVTCVDKGLRNRTIKFRSIIPAPSWKQVMVTEAVNTTNELEAL
jgi:hypothetical protein